MALVPAVLTLNVSPCSFSVAVDTRSPARFGQRIADRRCAEAAGGRGSRERWARTRRRSPRARPVVLALSIQLTGGTLRRLGKGRDGECWTQRSLTWLFRGATP
ncbi:MAG: hypothetical protein M0008_05230 [Actinomycetota bacterium]|nr:hypothetical protein [Actinomycetota bacterium]